MWSGHFSARAFRLLPESRDLWKRMYAARASRARSSSTRRASASAAAGSAMALAEAAPAASGVCLQPAAQATPAVGEPQTAAPAVGSGFTVAASAI